MGNLSYIDEDESSSAAFMPTSDSSRLSPVLTEASYKPRLESCWATELLHLKIELREQAGPQSAASHNSMRLLFGLTTSAV